MAGNNIVTKTVNQITYQIDNNGYNRAIKQIKSIRQEWEKVNSVMSSLGNRTRTGLQDQIRDMQRLSNLDRRLNRNNKNQDVTRRNVGGAGSAAARRERQQRLRDFANNRNRNRNTPPPSDFVGPPRPPSAADRARVEQQNRDAAARAQAQAALAERNRRIEAQRQNAANRARERAEAMRRVTGANEVIGNSNMRLQSRYGANFANQLGGAQLARLQQELRAGAISAARYRTSVAALEAQFRSAQSSALGFRGGLNDLRSSFVGLTGAYTAFSSIKSIQSTGQFFQGLNATMAMTTNSPEQAADRMKFLREQVLRLGVDYKTAAQGFTQMAVSADGQLNDDQLKGLFKGYSEYATALQIDPVKYQRGITAIQQMLGKGVIMSEELKSQLAEGVAGSMQVFLKASQKFFKDDKMDIGKMQKLMKDGKLLAKDILPLVAEEYAKSANKGGALTLALQSNRVAMQRLGTTWMLAQDQMFSGKMEQSLTKIYNGLTNLLNWNEGEFAKGLGKTFGNIAEGAWDMFTYIHDAFFLASVFVEHYAKKMGIEGANLNKAWDWAGWTVGLLGFLYASAKLFKVLTAIVGLRAALASVMGLMAGGAATGAAAGAGGGALGGAATGAAAGAATAGKTLVKRAGWVGLVSYLAGSFGGDMLSNALPENVNNNVGNALYSIPGYGAINDALFGTWKPTTGIPDFTSAPPETFTANNGGKGDIYIPPPPPSDVNLIVKIDETGVTQLVDSIILEHDQRNVNLLLQP